MVAQGTGPDGLSEPRMTPHLGAPGQGGAGQGAKGEPWAGGAGQCLRRQGGRASRLGPPLREVSRKGRGRTATGADGDFNKRGHEHWRDQCTEVLGHGRKRGDAWVVPGGPAQMPQGWDWNLDRSTGSGCFLQSVCLLVFIADLLEPV